MGDVIYEKVFRNSLAYAGVSLTALGFWILLYMKIVQVKYGISVREPVTLIFMGLMMIFSGLFLLFFLRRMMRDPKINWERQGFSNT